jgi:ankyrin repeat protein
MSAVPPSVPHDVTLDQLKKQARRLLRALHDGDDDAAAQLTEQHPRRVEAPAAKLTDAQLVLARTYGFDSWPKLRRHVLGRNLRRAIWDHDLDAVRAAVDEEADVLHEAGPHPMWGGQPTPLQVAAERGETQVVRLLLDRGARIDDPSTYGWTPLQLAAHWDRAETAQLLRERGAAVDLATACLLDDADEVRRQLQEDASQAARPGPGASTPLACARRLEVARLLVEAGAPLDADDGEGEAPLTAALGRGAHDVARFLLEQGAQATACQLAALGDVAALTQRLDDDPGALTATDLIGLLSVRGTPLHAAVHHGHEEVVRLLLERGADVNARCDMGQTALHNCSVPAIARRLLDAGADPTLVDDEHGTTPLAWARIAIDIRGETPARRELLQILEEVTPA